ncbi:Sn1-specific diacylglycerol lipase alpha [Auxenochlorella protothecoides]|uniref:sn-1-specific diacylglycerol lipase n=1 Tax=Auxenochlorella protothecoides TaxID=3075 RepID=A0A087SHW5_AUXPR|nr:Sn1-specific diacylglycerol lipase alpha [Auxenochlorella protothecoides]KFM25319.1 Sn1-specific diacylglycerol lipase alpha [Auxenochlorella protothecoides]
MQQTALDGSDATAQREIALSLKMLFGGIDLDPTDRFLAAFLVSEAQHRQRRRHATAMLEATGLVPAPRSRNRLLGWLGAGGGVRRGRLGGIGPDAVAGGVGAEAVARLPSAGCLGNGDAGMPGLCGGAEKEGAGAPLLPIVGLRAAAAVYTGAQRPVERAVLERARLVSRFAVGAYALQGVVWNRGVRPPACMGNLNMLVKCLRGPLRLEPALRRRNLEAMLGVAGIARGDLLHVSYANAQGGALPYAIALHRESRSVVLALRGTVTMEDLITDLLSAPIDVSEWLPDWVLDANEGGKPLYAHAGIVSSATAVLQDLDEHGLLKELLLARLEHAAGTPADDITEERGACTGPAAQRISGAEPPPLSVARAILRSKRGWRVVVTGHSLGAAVACMLSFQLRDQFPDLECWAFNPPGGLLSWNLSRLARRFCTSVVVGKDVISRLCFSNMKRVVDEMVLSLARCRRPKLKVTSCPVHELSDEVLRRLEKYHATSHLHAASQPELYPPGRLIFLRPFKGQGVAHTWDAVWVDAATLMGEGILLAPSMLAHHRMFTLADAFAEVLREGHEAALEELSTDPDTPC